MAMKLNKFVVAILIVPLVSIFWYYLSTKYSNQANVEKYDKLISNIGKTLYRNEHVSTSVCIVGGGIASASFSYFLRRSLPNAQIYLFEKENQLGGRIKSFQYENEYMDAGANIIHSKNLLMKYFTTLLNLTHNSIE